ncbi:MAG: hypothetical protein ACOC44_01140 [Promethearchaeia archaeon]
MRSVTEIYEQNRDDEDRWGNHTFTAKLEKYPDFNKSSEDPEETAFTAFMNYFRNNWLAILLIIVTLIVIGIAFWKIRHENIKRRYKAFKKDQQEKKINQKNKKEDPYDAVL